MEIHLVVCLFDLILHVPSTIFQLKQDGSSWFEPVLSKLGLMCLAQGHNTVTPVMLEPAAPRSRVKHSTTEPLCSHGNSFGHLNLCIRVTSIHKKIVCVYLLKLVGGVHDSC